MSTKPVITDIRGVGEVRAKQLKGLGINSVAALAAAPEATLISLRGVSPRIAAELAAHALKLLDAQLPIVAHQITSDPSDNGSDKVTLPKQTPATLSKSNKDKKASKDTLVAKPKKEKDPKPEKNKESGKKTTKKAAKAEADKKAEKKSKKSNAKNKKSAKKEVKSSKAGKKTAKKAPKGKKDKK